MMKTNSSDLFLMDSPGFMWIFWENHPDPPVIKDGNVEHSPIP